VDSADTLTRLTLAQADALRHGRETWLHTLAEKVDQADTSDDLLEVIGDLHAVCRIWVALDDQEIALDLQTRALIRYWRDELSECAAVNEREDQILNLTEAVRQDGQRIIARQRRQIAALDQLLA
jgi:hypothetical protein